MAYRGLCVNTDRDRTSRTLKCILGQRAFRASEWHPSDLGCLTRARYKPTMRFQAKGAPLLLLFCMAAVPVGSAQQKQAGSAGTYRANGDDPAPQYKTTASRPLTPDEGLAILNAALDSRHNKR